MIQRRVRHEARRLIDLDQPRFGFLIEEDVDAEDLEAKLVLKVLRLRCLLDVSDLVTARNNRLHRQLLELLPALLGADDLGVLLPLLIDRLKDGRQTAFVTEVVSARVLHKVLALLVDRVVGQMHAEVVEVAAEGRDVVLRREPRQALLVNEDAQRNDTCDQHIYAQIELQIVNEEWFVQVALGDVMLANLHPIVIPR